MTTEKILTAEEIIALGKQAHAIESGENGYILPVKFARAIEQAVLQSEQAQAGKLDDLIDSEMEQQKMKWPSDFPNKHDRYPNEQD